jgi:hypothetical protein
MPQQTTDITQAGITNRKQLDEKIVALRSAISMREVQLGESLPKLPGEALKKGMILGTDFLLLSKISLSGTGMVSNLLSLLLKGKEKNQELHTKEKLKGNLKSLSLFSGLKAGFNIFKESLRKKTAKEGTL